MLRLAVLGWRDDARFINRNTGEIVGSQAGAVDLLALLTGREIQLAWIDPVLEMALQLGAVIRRVEVPS